MNQMDRDYPEQEELAQEEGKQLSGNDGDKTQSLLYRLWLKSQQKRKAKMQQAGKERQEPQEEKSPSEEEVPAASFARQASVISDEKQTAWLENGSEDGVQELWRQWAQACGKTGESYDPFSELDPVADTGQQAAEHAEREKFMAELQQAAQVLLARKQLGEEDYNKNSLLSVRMLEDCMTVWLFAFPPLGGGIGLTEEAVDARLRGMGVNFGINRELIRRAAKEGLYFKLLPIARGRPAVDGIDGRLETCRQVTVELEQQKGQEGDLYRSTNQIARVSVGTPLFRAIPPIEMEMGINVKGVPVRGRAAKPVMMPKISNTQISPDGSTLLSTIDGYLTFENNRFLVKSMLVINGDVDYSMGNLNHTGDILIYGDVCEGLNIRATGTVEVRGMVESAQIYAGKNIVIGKGMNGNITGRLEAKGEIRSNFIENCDVVSGGDIYASSVLWSNISCGGSLYVTTGRGTIIGGKIAVIQNVEAKMIGNGSNRYTSFVIGSTPEIIAKQKELENQIKTIQERLREVVKDLDFLEKQKSLDPYHKQAQSRLKLEKPLLQMKERQKLNELGEVCAVIHSSNKGKIRCEVLNSGTDISIGSASIVIKTTYYMCNIYYWEDEIVIGTC